MKNVIVTGANGFVGAALVNELCKHDIHVIAVVRSENSNIDRIKGLENVEYVFCDFENVDNLDSLIDQRGFDVFYHFAWNGSAGKARADVNVQMSNAMITEKYVRSASKLGCKKFIGAGSIMELETHSAVYTNSNRPGSAYIYGNAKISAHTISKCVSAELGIEHVWGMITNAYGPGEISERFINTTIKKVFNNQTLQFTSGIQNYDFIYIDDVAKAFYYLGLNGLAFNNYVIGSGNAKQLRNFIEEMCYSIDSNAKLQFGDVPFTGVNIPKDFFSIESLVSDTGFSPQTDFSTGILNTANWIKETSNNDFKV